MLYVAAVYALLPVGPRLGLAFMRSAPGGWLIGPGLLVVVLAGAGALVVRLRRRAAPPAAYAALAAVALAYVLALAWLERQHLERTHLPEYGVAAILAWRALGPHVRDGLARYAAAAALGAAIGYGEELVQAVVPGRHYDVRDVALNALGAVLGVVVLAIARAGSPPGVQLRAER